MTTWALPRAPPAPSKQGPVTRPSKTQQVSARPPDFAAHPTSRRVGAITPRSDRLSRPTSASVLNANAPATARSHGGRIFGSGDGYLAVSIASVEGLQVTDALKILFKAYDTDGDGYVDFEEFAEAQAAVATALDLDPDKQASLLLFFKASCFFEQRRGQRSGLCFEEFAEWQAGIWTEEGKTREELISSCHWAADVLARARSHLDSTLHTARSATSATSTLAVKYGAAGQAAAAVRQQRLAQRCGGGQSTMKQGFSETGKDTAMDMDEFVGTNDIHDSESSGDEADRPPEYPSIDAEIGPLKRELQQARGSMNAGHSLKRRLRVRIQELLQKREQQTRGRLQLYGTVWDKHGRMKNAKVHLSLTACGRLLGTSSSNRRGFFEHRVSALNGRALTLTAQKEGFASKSSCVGGDGLMQVRFQLPPLTIMERFEADASGHTRVSFVDSASQTAFSVPIGGLLKAGEAFTGAAEFSATVVDSAVQDSICLMPAPVGRTVAGSLVPIRSLGGVFTSLRDASDGEPLTLRPGSRIDVSFPSSAGSSCKPRSVWHYQEAGGQWHQTTLPVAMDGAEAPSVDADEEATETNGKDVVQLEAPRQLEEIDRAAKSLQAERLTLSAQRRAEGQKQICLCGFYSKHATLSGLRAKPGLAMTDPPKRIFAETIVDADGSLYPALPYLPEQFVEGSVLAASTHPEVILSHHLAAAQELLEPLSSAHCKGWPQGASKQWRQAAKRAIPHLEHIISWLLKGARALDASTGKQMDNISPGIFRLKTLERLINLWGPARVSNAPPTSLLELHEALRLQGDITTCFLQVGGAQALRNDVANVRKDLLDRVPLATATFLEVQKALAACHGEVAAASEMLAQDASVKLQALKSRIREEVYATLPLANPSSRAVEKAIADVEEQRQQKELEFFGKEENAERKRHELTVAMEECVTAQQEVKAAIETGTQVERAHAEQKLDEASEHAKVADEAAKEAEGEAKKALVAAAELTLPNTVLMLSVQHLIDDPGAMAEVKKLTGESGTHEGTRSSERQFNFEVVEMGWSCIEASKDFVIPGPQESKPIHEADSAVQEFYPTPPLPVYPARGLSMALGGFGCDVEADMTTAHDVDQRGMYYGDEVLPDGSFSVVTTVSLPFELRTYKWDGSVSHNFGPFSAQNPFNFTHLGLLRKSHAEDVRRTARVVEVQVTLPRLEIPNRKEPSVSASHETRATELTREAASSVPLDRQEKCTCMLEEVAKEEGKADEEEAEEGEAMAEQEQQAEEEKQTSGQDDTGGAVVGK